jgi:4-hydroxythreonine-4-phosphate dehydrogenase
MEVAGREVAIVPCKQYSPVTWGKLDRMSGGLAYEALQKSLQWVQERKADAVLTLPVSKEALQLAGFRYLGQTEFFTHETGNTSPMMILCTENARNVSKTSNGHKVPVRVGLVTIHIPIADVAQTMTTELIYNKICQFAHSMKHDFACSSPRIAVLALNPHAGENGAIGGEEQTTLIPAIHQLQKAAVSDFQETLPQGASIEGPFPADGFFAHGMYRDFDGIMAMYHDQGLIPLKILAGGAGVNFTAGLDIIRTSPDHGTGFGIAGKNLASPDSTIEAIEVAHSIIRSRGKLIDT